MKKEPDKPTEEKYGEEGTEATKAEVAGRRHGLKYYPSPLFLAPEIPYELEKHAGFPVFV